MARNKGESPNQERTAKTDARPGHNIIEGEKKMARVTGL
ncbi:hypothetical protein PMI09_01120, partial [Rhizobium sp. CF122]